MKFTKGYWQTREGVTIHGAVDVRHIDIDANRVTAHIAPKKIFGRGQTLEGPLITVEFTSPACNIIGVKAYHYKGIKKCGAEFNINDKELVLTVEQNEKSITVISGKLKAVLNKDPFDLSFFYEDKFLTASATKQLAYITDNGKPYFRERLHLSVGECIYGLGERFSAFVKNGQSIDMWNEDGGTASELSYKNVPFYLSNRGYGVFVNNTGRVSYEIASEAVAKAQFSVDGEELNYFVIGGDDLKQVVGSYCEITGKPALPPAWSFGLWLSTSFTTDYNEETVNHFIDGMFERDIPLSVFHFDCFWMSEYEWCNFEWDTAQFPEPSEMLRRLSDKGLKICVWINPYIGQKSKLFDTAMEKGYMLKRPNGDVWQWDLWQPGMGIVDFTNPEAVSWYQGCLRKLLDMGVNCFKTDFGERIPTDVVYYDGSDPVKMHNYYAYLYNKTVFELLEEYNGKQNAVLFARSSTTGGQKFPVHWGGDCDATYESMEESLRGGLSLVSGGFGFWSHDIGGFESTAPADIYKRWVAFGLFSTHSRLHGSSSYRVPWLYDEESVDVLRHFTKIKLSLMPYLFTQACKTAKTGVPVIRPMVMEYQNDIACSYLDKQYMFGEDILAAPVFNKEGDSEIYLPEGKFTHILTNETEEGGRYIKRKYDYFNLHAWAKPNSIIPMCRNSGTVVYDYTDSVDFHIYELENAQTEIYDKGGNKKVELNAKTDGGKILINIDGTVTNAKIVLHNDGVIKEINIPNGQNELIIESYLQY